MPSSQSPFKEVLHMKISHEKYCVFYDSNQATIRLEGSMRFQGSEPDYQQIISMLEAMADQESSLIIIDLRSLQFLNSLGISLLSKFVINIRKRKTVQLTVLGNEEIPWQGKSLKNLQRLMPSLKLEIQ